MTLGMPSVKCAALAACCAGVWFASGCSTTGPERAARAAESLQALQADLQKANELLGAAVTSLTDLVENPAEDLQPQYTTFANAMTALDSQLEVIRRRSDAMEARGREYFQAWETQLQEIQSEELKAHAEERRAKLNEHYDAIQAEMARVGELGTPVLAALRDTKKYLGVDLTAEGLKLAADPAARAKKSAAPLEAEVEKLLKDLGEVATLLSPAAAPGETSE